MANSVWHEQRKSWLCCIYYRPQAIRQMFFSSDERRFTHKCSRIMLVSVFSGSVNGRSAPGTPIHP